MLTTLKFRSRLARFVGCALLLATSGNVLYGQERDRVYPAKGGAMTTGKITSRTAEKVIIEPSRGGPVEFPSFEVGRIVFDGEPTSLSNAKQSAMQGNWTQANNELSQVSAAALTSDSMKEEFQFYKGLVAAKLAMNGTGDPLNAAKLLVDWSRANASSHNYFLAMETLGDLAMSIGNATQAPRFYTLVANSTQPDISLKGNYLLGRSLLGQGNIDEAKAKFTATVQPTVTEPASLRLQKLARIALIRCEAEGGDPASAIAALEKLVSEEDSSDGALFAEIFNTLGNIYDKQNNTYEAVLAFLKTDKLYPNQTEAHAEALYHLTKLWPKVGEPLRGNQAKAELVRLYPASAWAKK